jgi:hypothetical protein
VSSQLQDALDKVREDRAQGKPQQLVALDLANAVRTGRAAIKRGLADGSLRAKDVILDPPAVAAKMPIMDVLMAQRYWGKDRTLRLLLVAQVREGRTLGELTARQRGVLVDLLALER